MYTTYAKIKVFPDEGIELTLSKNKKVSQEIIEYARQVKEEKKKEKGELKSRIIAEINRLTFLESDKRKREILEKELNDLDTPQINYLNLKHTARRARQTLYDICKCNDFQFFVTFTYDPEKKERLNDEVTRRTFSVWANNMRRYYPNMYYIAVPEYHKKGGIHYHMLVGGIKWEDLKPKFWKLDKNGTPVYNVTAWTWGYSTVTRIKNGEAAKHYVCKYITKQHFDERFFGKRRFHTSHNIVRPTTYRAESDDGSIWGSLNLNLWQVKYLHKRKHYGVFYCDGTGAYVPEYNDRGTREAMEYLAEISKPTRGNAAADEVQPQPTRGNAASHLTIGTHNSIEPTIEYEDGKYWLDY